MRELVHLDDRPLRVAECLLHQQRPVLCSTARRDRGARTRTRARRRPNEARVLNTLGLLETGPDPRGSLPTLERSSELAQAVGDNWCLAEATQNVGWALLLAGEHDAARAMLEASFEIARRHGWRELVAWHGWMLGDTENRTGDRDKVRGLWERCLEGASDVHDGLATWSLGLVDVDAGRPAEALERLEAGRGRMVSAGVGLDLPFLEGGIAPPKPRSAGWIRPRRAGRRCAGARRQVRLGPDDDACPPGAGGTPPRRPRCRSGGCRGLSGALAAGWAAPQSRARGLITSTSHDSLDVLAEVAGRTAEPPGGRAPAGRRRPRAR